MTYVKKVNRRLLTQMKEETLKPFYVPSDVSFPVTLLEERYDLIRQEYMDHMDVDSLFAAIPAYGKLYTNGEWSVVPFLHNGDKYYDHVEEDKFIDTEKEFPVLSSTLKEVFGGAIQSAGFSKMTAGTHILPHRGVPANMLRLHLGIDVPSGDLGIKVLGETRTWDNGKVLIFDDRVMHEAWNKSDEDRVILIVDFVYDHPGFFEERIWKKKS